ncbi:MAG: rRNA pseudouridine synthase [Erysipelotrichia bacterium]|nr:rRNA pseudouridine synthase [Erysipelotrichia bacterium]NCC54891.1 rRNA pseudouridine synthase [Erysipelotrichia bacterium]
MRLDKFLAHANFGTRKEVKKMIRLGWVSVNGKTIKNDDYKIEETKDIVCVDEVEVQYQQFYYLMLNKPSGYVSATIDDRYPTVLDLIEEDFALDLFPVGRLDLDSEGLLLLSNDGALSHELLAPKKHVDKEYYVELRTPYSEEDIKKLEAGVAINEQEVCKEAKVTRIDENKMYLIIQEGKFHQVKRMMHAIDNEVTYLKRVRMGSLVLDETLALGQYRMLSDEEITRLKNKN